MVAVMKKPTLKELDIERDSDGWWAYCPDGWCNGSDPGCHTFHEDTRKELVQAIRDFLEPCGCKDCAAAKGGDA